MKIATYLEHKSLYNSIWYKFVEEMDLLSIDHKSRRGQIRTWNGVQGLQLEPMIRRERDLFIDILLVRIYLIIWMILVDGPCAMGV